MLEGGKPRYSAGRDSTVRCDRLESKQTDQQTRLHEVVRDGLRFLDHQRWRYLPRRSSVRCDEIIAAGAHRKIASNLKRIRYRFRLCFRTLGESKSK